MSIKQQGRASSHILVFKGCELDDIQHSVVHLRRQSTIWCGVLQFTNDGQNDKDAASQQVVHTTSLCICQLYKPPSKPTGSSYRCTMTWTLAGVIIVNWLLEMN